MHRQIEYSSGIKYFGGKKKDGTNQRLSNFLLEINQCTTMA
jgi:hypothetical protein